MSTNNPINNTTAKTEKEYTYIAPKDTDFDLAAAISTPLESKTNIPTEVMDKISRFSNENNMPMILRPVNPLALLHLKNGAAGKSMFVHGKSAESGLAKGLIPVNASISKAGKSGDVLKIQTFQKENEHSLHLSNATIQTLQQQFMKAAAQLAPENRTTEAIMKEAGLSLDHFAPIITTVKLKDANGNQIYIFEGKGDAKLAAKDPINAQEHLYAIALDNNQFQRIDGNHEPVGKPFLSPNGFHPVALEVFGKPEISIGSDGQIILKEVNPITADIDTLAFGSQEIISPKKVTNYDEVIAWDARRVKDAKIAAIIEASLGVWDEAQAEQFASKSTAECIKTLNSQVTPSGVFKNSKALKELSIKLKEIDSIAISPDQREHLRGMGDGSRIVHEVVAKLRILIGKDILSHGSEQFNYNFTQPLDSEWVIKLPNTSVEVVHSEAGLMDIFSEVKKNGYHMPPNPNWGWRLNKDNKYEIDQELKEQNKFVDTLLFLDSKTVFEAYRQDTQRIQQLRVDLGKLSLNLPADLPVTSITTSLGKKLSVPENISTTEREMIINACKTALNSAIKDYNTAYPKGLDTSADLRRASSEYKKIRQIRNERDKDPIEECLNNIKSARNLTISRKNSGITHAGLSRQASSRDVFSSATSSRQTSGSTLPAFSPRASSTSMDESPGSSPSTSRHLSIASSKSISSSSIELPTEEEDLSRLRHALLSKPLPWQNVLPPITNGVINRSLKRSASSTQVLQPISEQTVTETTSLTRSSLVAKVKGIVGNLERFKATSSASPSRRSQGFRKSNKGGPQV